MKRLLTGWLLALLPLLALAQPAPEKIRLANTMAEFQPVPGKYVVFLPPGQSSASAKAVAEKVPGLKILQTLPAPAAMVVNMPAGAEVMNGTNARAAASLGGEAIRPVYRYIDGTEEAPTGTVAVRFKSISEKKNLASLAAGLDASYRTSELDATLGYLDLPAGANPFEVARQLQKNPSLAWAEPDMLKFLKRQGSRTEGKPSLAPVPAKASMAPQAPQITLPNDPLMVNQWYLHNGGRSAADYFWNNSDVKVFEAWDHTQGSSSIKVAVIDEGVDLAHPDLSGQLLTGFDATGLNSGGGPQGDDAHGTACSGIIAGKAGNGIGVAGVAPNCKIVPVRIAYSDASGNWVTSNAWIGNAIQWAWKNGQADILSNSWGGGSSSSLITNPIDSAVLKGRGGKGAPVIFAAGNSNSSSSFFPATYSRVIGVIAMSMCDTRKTPTSCDGETWWGSNYGVNGDVAAPGVIMTTLDISGSTGYSAGDYTSNFNGTSSACPTVAGVMALLLSNNPNLTEAQARVLLESTCDKVGTYTYNTSVSGQPNGTWSTDLGYGRVNALRVVNTAANARLSTVTQVYCNTTVSGTTSGSSYFTTYACNPGAAYTGPEAAHTVFMAKGSSVTLKVIPTGGTNVDLFVLKRFHKDSCLAASALPGTMQDSLTFVAPYTGFYYILIDGVLSTSYTLQTICTLPPTITDFNPKVANFGDLITVTGTNLTPINALKLNGATIPSFSNSATSITFNVPNGAASGPIQVVTPGGTATSASNLIIAGQACATAQTLACGDSVTSTNVGATNIFTTYKCQTWSEIGPEKVYKIQGTVGTTLTATLSGMTGDLDIFLLSACNPDSCVASGDASLTATLKNQMYYLIVDGYSGATSAFKLKLTCSSLQNCRATSNCGSNDFIKDVTLNTLSNLNTGCAGTGGWINYPPTGTLTTTLTKGSAYNYFVRFGVQFKQKSAIWIDYNNDGDFIDAKECVVLKNVQDSILSGSFTVPMWAVSGNLKMRIRCSYNTNLDTAGSCTNTSFGETEDYTITLTSPVPPSITVTSVTPEACIGSDVQFFFNTSQIPPGTVYTVWASTDSTSFTQLSAANNVVIIPSSSFIDSPGSFQTNFPMAPNQDSIKVWIEVRSSTGVVSNRVRYWQFNKANPTGPEVVERCGAGPMSITLENIPSDATVDWYTEGNFVSSGITLDVANQTATATYYASILNRYGCSASFSTQFEVNPQPRINSYSPGYAGVGQSLRLRGTGFATVTSVKHGALPASFSLDGDTAILLVVPVGATANRVYVSTGEGCNDSTSIVPMNAPFTWPITYGNTGDDYVRGLVRDASGNVYASIAFTGSITLQGTVINAGTKRDGLLVKFNDQGQLLWYTRIGNNIFNTEPRGVNIDGSGNPVWAGSFAGSVTFTVQGGSGQVLTAAGSYDAFVARFDPTTGSCVWARRVGGAGNDYLYACFVSNSGNVYAGGSYTGAITFQVGANNVNLPNAGGLDGFIVKFDPSGTGLYASSMGSTADDEVKSIEYNGGDLIACGYMGNNITFPAGTNASPSSITLPSLNGSRDAWAARINSEGRCVWVKNFGTIFNDEAQSICLDPSTGNVFVAAQVADAPMAFNGGSFSGYGNNDIAVVGWNFYTQAPVWAKRVGSSTGDVPTSIRWDGQRLVVAGYAGGSLNTAAGGIGTLTSNGGQDAVLLRYDKASGNVTSGQLYGGSGNDQAQALWCNTANREAFVGGGYSSTVTFPATGGSVVRTSAGAYDGFIFRTIPASGASASFAYTGREGVTAGALRAWPNPASKSVNVQSTEGGTMELIDTHGRVMARQALEAGTSQTVNLIGLPKGLYVLRQGRYSQRLTVE